VLTAQAYELISAAIAGSNLLLDTQELVIFRNAI
jgi:hypothetical protein